jgi:putative DNA primase/helicase
MASGKFDLGAIQPWPEPVDGTALLGELLATFNRHLALPDSAADVMALWVLFAHAFDAAQISPRLALTSPLPVCGKTTALSLLRNLVPRPLLASNMSPAVVFRAIEEYSPTVLMDEADTYIEHNDEFRGILNSGHTREGALVWRCHGQDHEPKGFTTWAPMAIAKIGELPDTLATRSIIVEAARRRLTEVRFLKAWPGHQGVSRKGCSLGKGQS